MRRVETVQQIVSSSDGSDPALAEQLLPLVYDELRGMAARYLARERHGHTLQPTALVHEAYMRLVGSEAPWKGRAAFLAAAAVAMRRVLVESARRRATAKRGERAPRVTLGAEDTALSRRDVHVLELDDLLERLAAHDARKSRVVELRLFAGMTNDEIAAALGVARSTVADDWAVARAWLASELGGGEGGA